jgi:outer membrane receptor protein involved in Fe transport
MGRTAKSFILSPVLFFCLATVLLGQEIGGIRGTVYDKDFDVPLAAAQISIAETGEKVTTTDQGNFVFSQVKPGTYTLVFSKEGYTRQVKADVVVSPGKMTELDVSLSGEFIELEEFIVQYLELGGTSEIDLLNLRMESPSLMDSISSDLMRQAGASDVASALSLVSGTTVQEGKYAVVRGLPDRYVNSQLNGVRLPTADPDKRAVQLDQFPAPVIKSIQVSKTFTPDQQGDASGGAVNVVTKGIPDETILQFSGQISYNSQVTGKSDFLTYKGGGVDFWGIDDGGRDIQTGNIGGNWGGAVGVSREDAPVDYKWSLAAGGKHEFDDGIKVGGFGSLFYERDSSFYDDGIDDKYWVETPGAPMTPQYVQGTPDQENFKTQLFDVTQGSEEVKWGTLGVLGVETENHSLSLLHMYTRVAEDVATLAEDTRGKQFLHRYWPSIYGPEYDNYDPYDPCHPGNQQRDAAPYLRTETLQYTERTTQTLQLSGRHKLPDPKFGKENFFTLLNPEMDWGISFSSAGLNQPDKRQFGSLWWAESYDPGFPPTVPPSIEPAVHYPFKPAENFTLGNLQRVWKDISEDSEQYFLNVKLPFEQWSGDEGYLKLGLFNDEVDRKYEQDSFSNFSDVGAQYEAPWADFWSRVFPSEDHAISDGPPYVDVDYDGQQEISAWYYMADLPLCSFFSIIGGARHETTDLSIVNHPEQDVTWIPPGATGPVKLNPGDADVSFSQSDVLPSIGFEYKPLEKVTLRGSYSETVARQTFKELTPIIQQEFLGGDVFIGNPSLAMSALKNYDLRLDYTPYDGGLVSLSYFYKDITDPIEYVQRNAGFTYTTPMNYPQGELSGYEIEVRQRMGRFWDELEGFSVGANATIIDSEVKLPADEAAGFNQPNIMAPMSTRDMTNAPEYLYNFFLTYDLQQFGTQLGLFYTVNGDTLVAGAGQSNGRYIPNVYQEEYGTLNLSLLQKIGKNCNLTFQVKNLLDPKIESVYRSEYIGDDITKTSYRKGIEFSISLSAKF